MTRQTSWPDLIITCSEWAISTQTRAESLKNTALTVRVMFIKPRSIRMIYNAFGEKWKTWNEMFLPKNNIQAAFDHVLSLKVWDSNCRYYFEICLGFRISEYIILNSFISPNVWYHQNAMNKSGQFYNRRKSWTPIRWLRKNETRSALIR